MKTRPFAVVQSVGAVAVASLLSTFLALPSRGSESPRDHHLIVGSDFTVKLGDKIHPVVGAGDRSFVIQQGGRTKEIPLRKLKDIQISRGLKLTRLAARIEKMDAILSSDMAVAEQHEAAQNAMALTTVAQIQRDRALGEALDLEFSRGLFDSTSGVAGVQQTIAIIEAKLNGTPGVLGAWDKLAVADQQIMLSSSMRSDVVVRAGTQEVNNRDEVELLPAIGPTSAYLIVSGAGATKKPSPVAPALVSIETNTERIKDAGGGRSDRFDLEFDVSSPERIENAYLVLVTEFSPPQRETETFRRVLTEKLGALTPTPRRVRLYQTGFPPGFSVRTYVVTLYADGQEIATNVSDAKMSMTREEAQQYVFAEHLAANRGKTLPPAAVLMTSRSTLRQVAADPNARVPVYVSVDEDGKVVSISSDNRTQRPPPPVVATALQHFYFVPALKNGVPAPGRAKLVVAEFAR